MADVVYVAGARPNFMKIAPILEAAKGAPFSSVLVHTGQHYDHAMSGVFFEQLGIPKPDAHLGVGSGGHGVQTGRIMAAFEEYLLDRPKRPQGIVVVGDVNSTMACALVGAKLGIFVAHVEAGLRSFDRAMPEEINRVVTDAVSDLLLVSEPSGMENLSNEHIPPARIQYVGNVMIDTLVAQLPAARALGMPKKLGVEPGAFAVVTLHRPSNVDDPARLMALVDFLVRTSRELPVVFSVHPRTAARLRGGELQQRLAATANIKLIEPLGYREFLGLLEASRLIITDSGGIQEEATFLGTPCITLRSNTERPITISAGTNVLVGEDLALASTAAENALKKSGQQACSVPGWDGKAAHRIIEALCVRLP